MGLYERMLQVRGERPRIQVHGFQAVMAEWVRGRLTDQQAFAALDHLAGEPKEETALTPGERGELIALRNGIAALPASERWRFFQELDAVLLLMDARTPPYDTPAALRARLGV